jgi:hypothetical protein
MITRGKFGLIGALILTTVLWGTAVAAHQHLEIHQDLCEICLLPHTAAVAPATLQPLHPGPACQTETSSAPARPTAPFAAYQSRAPPR